MILHRACCLIELTIIASLSSVVANGSLPDIDLAASRVSPAGDVQSIGAEGARHLQFDVQSKSPNAQISLVFHRLVSLAGKDRLVREGRGEESTGLAVHVSRVTLLDADGRSVAVHQEDLMFPPEWNRRTLLLDDFDRRPTEPVRAIVVSLWEPGEVGRRYTLRLRRCEFISPEQVAAELRPIPKKGRPARTPPASTAKVESRHWTNLGPGGGGWYRTVAISPHDGVCLIGGDVGGVYRSTDQCRSWSIVNSGIPNTYINTFAFHPRDLGVVYAGCNGGVLKSTDGGQSWHPANKGLPTKEEAWRIIAHPQDPNTYYLGWHRQSGYGPPPQ